MENLEKQEQWEKVKGIFADAVERESSARSAFLDEACGADRELRAEVESLLAEFDRSVSFSQQPFPVGAFEAAPPDTIGPYRLIRKLGEGGMGQVWLAEQTAPVARHVALKLIRAGFYDESVLQRFQSERQSLAMMNHPAIAKVFDAGTTVAGQPYLVMEYVAGQPITDYCDEKKLTIRERIELFIQACEGVQHAHQKAIIHRDLKPANILVVEVDGKPMPRIIDFGLAKAVTPLAAGATLVTQPGNFLGTPGYMSPEQSNPGEVDIDTRTDVYSLGVVLYVLLSGLEPFDTRAWRKLPFDEVLRKLREEDPPRPSTRVSTDRAASSVAAKARLTEPKQLATQLRGDLDSITMKAVEKDRVRRYGTSSELAADLQRYLNNEPVLARPDTVAYRAAKFLRRNRTAVAFATVATALVIGSLSTGLLIANRERKVAEQRFAQVRQLANKFIALDEGVRGLPGSTKVRMQMVSDALQYLTSLGSDVHGDKDLALEIAYAYVRVAHAQGDPTSPNLGQFAEAEASLDKAQSFVDSVLKVDPRNKRGLFIAATIAHDRMALAETQNRREEMVSWAGQASELVERFMNLGNADARDVYSMGYFETNVAYVYVDARHFADALRASHRALNIIEPVQFAHRLHGGILHGSAIAHWQSGDLEGALQSCREAIQLQETEAASGAPSLRINLTKSLHTEGMILGKQDAEPSLGRTRDALAALQRGLDIGEDLAKVDPIDNLSRGSIATIGLEIGNILRHNDPQKALAVYDHALARIREAKTNVSTQLFTADLLAGSSYALRWAGRDKEARQRIDDALQLLREAHQYPADTVEPMSESDHVLRAAADDYAQTGQTAKAIAVYQELLDKLMAWKPDLQNDLRDATCISRTWTALAKLLRRTGRTEEATQLEAQRTELWNHWNSKLPNAQFLLRQSLSQITPHPPRNPR